MRCTARNTVVSDYKLPTANCPLTFSQQQLYSYITDRLIIRMVMQHMDAEQLDTTFAALADPTRRAILARLAEGEATVTELAAPFDMSMPAISKHLKVLERAGLISRGRAAQWRPCRLQAGPLGDATEWLEQYRPFWEGSFDRLAEHLRQIQKGQQSG
jgi:DNA-binding transcriptional ArsR family regulator